LPWFEFESGKFQLSYPFLFRMENHVCLSRHVYVTGATWRAVTRIVAGVVDLVQRTKDGQAQVEYSVAGRSRSRVMLCAVCAMHKETRNTSFLVEPQNQGRRVSWFGPQNRQLRFGDLANKITATVSWFAPQNQVGYGLSVAPQNRREDEDGVGHMLGSSGLVHLEAYWVRVS
jgi:hypothetical protein